MIDTPGLLDTFIHASHLDERWKTELMDDSLFMLERRVLNDQTVMIPQSTNPLTFFTNNVENDTEVVVTDDTMSAYDRAMKLLD